MHICREGYGPVWSCLSSATAQHVMSKGAPRFFDGMHGTKPPTEAAESSHDTDVLLKETIGGEEMVFSLRKKNAGHWQTKQIMNTKDI